MNNLENIDAMAILSFFLGYENLMENRSQSRHNDVQSANDQQAKFLLEQLMVEFNKQNEMLEKILDRLDNENN